MLKLNVILDLNADSKSVSFEEDFDTDNLLLLEIAIGIRKQEDYDNLSFGYSLIRDGSLIKEVNRPEDNLIYLRSNQNFIDFNVVEHTAEIEQDKTHNYVINFWCEESGERFEGSHSFSVTIPGIVDPYPDGSDATPESVGKAYLLENQ